MLWGHFRKKVSPWLIRYRFLNALNGGFVVVLVRGSPCSTRVLLSTKCNAFCNAFLASLKNRVKKCKATAQARPGGRSYRPAWYFSNIHRHYTTPNARNASKTSFSFAVFIIPLSGSFPALKSIFEAPHLSFTIVTLDLLTLTPWLSSIHFWIAA